MLSELQEGFDELFSVKAHRLPILGCQSIRIGQEFKLFNNVKTDMYLTWDSKHLHVWEKGQKSRDKPYITHSLKSPKNQVDYVHAAVYSASMKVFVIASNDLSFKVYDNRLNLLSSLTHNERRVNCMLYNSRDDTIIVATTSGLSIWKLHKPMALGRIGFKMEKLCDFNDISLGWVSFLTLDDSHSHLLATIDKSAYDFNLLTRTVNSKLENIHDTSLTRVCWYEKCKYYITGCREGVIRLWVSHFDRNSNKPFNLHSDGNFKSDYSFVHCFQSHKNAISGLEIHDHKSILISSSMDCTIKLFDLDIFSELMSISLESAICIMSKISYGKARACLIALDDGTLKLWKMTSCCDLAACSTSPIRSIQAFNESSDSEVLVALTTHDIFGIKSNYDNFFTLESSLLADGVTAITIDILSNKVYCVMDDGYLRIFSMQTTQSELLSVIQLAEVNPDLGVVTCIAIINEISASEFHGCEEYSAVDPSKDGLNDFSGQIIALASSKGLVNIINVKQNAVSLLLSVAGNCSGAIHSIKYRPAFRDLVVLGDDIEANIKSPGKYFLAARLWSLPKMVCTHTILEQAQSTCSNVSLSLPYIGFGFEDGSTRIFHVLNAERTQNLSLSQRVKEIYSPAYISEVSTVQIHNGRVISIVFCDALRIYATSGVDGCIILVTLDKRPIRTISLHQIPASISFFGQHGDIAAAIDRNIVIIRKERWNFDTIVVEIGASDEIDPYHWGSNWASNILESLVIDKRYTNENEINKDTHESNILARSSANILNRNKFKPELKLKDSSPQYTLPILVEKEKNMPPKNETSPSISVSVLKSKLFSSETGDKSKAIISNRWSITEKIIDRLKRRDNKTIAEENIERAEREQRVLKIANAAVGIKLDERRFHQVALSNTISNETVQMKDEEIRDASISDSSSHLAPTQPTVGSPKLSFQRGRNNVRFIEN